VREQTKRKSKKKQLEQQHNTKIKRNKERNTNKKARTKARTRARAHKATAKEKKTRIGHIYRDIKVGHSANTRTKPCKQQIWANTSRH
jgi:hypothetical protein